jgi:hypothetical protein
MTGLIPDFVEIEDSPEAIQDFFETQGWSDGLPVIPPTEARVHEMFRYIDYGPRDVIARLEPMEGEATVQRIAANAVLAGCRPEYMPVLIAAVQAIAEPAFSLRAVQTTTHPCTVGLIVNGPIRHELAINCANNCFGPGWRANASIGRAMRFILLNIGGGIPGEGDKATHGSPAKFTLCIGENEEASPWEPFHVEYGYATEDNTVLALSCEAPHNINDHYGDTAEAILRTVAGSLEAEATNDMIHGTANPAIVFGPEHAETVARDGYSKAATREYLWEHVKREHLRPRRADQPPMRRLARTPQDIHIIVAGGAGKHSMWLPTFGHESSVLRRIEYSDGRPVRSVFGGPR